MIEVKCDKCKKLLEEPGGLIFSPPTIWGVDKMHICTGCWKGLMEWLWDHPKSE